MIEVQTVFAAAAPLAAPVENVAERSAPRANHPYPDSMISATTDRHLPLAQSHVNRSPARLDQDALSGPGDPRERRIGAPGRPGNFHARFFLGGGIQKISKAF